MRQGACKILTLLDSERRKHTVVKAGHLKHTAQGSGECCFVCFQVFHRERVENYHFNFSLENQIHKEGEYINDK